MYVHLRQFLTSRQVMGWIWVDMWFLLCATAVLFIMSMQARMVRPSEGVALSSGPLIDLLNYCTAVKFYSFDAFAGKLIWHESS